MYLSRITLDRNNNDVIKALSSPQVMHAMLQSCLPDSAPRSLWRVDRLEQSLVLLLQSHTPPTHSPFGSEPWETHDYDALFGRIREDQIFRFRLCANPVHSVKTSKESRGKVVAHVTVAQQKEWLLQRSSSYGFDICKTEREDLLDVVEQNTKKFKRQKAMVTLSTAVFDGVLQIHDVLLFTDAIKNGIGRGKAYGCGMLTLARM